MNKIFLIIQREYLTRVKKKTFIIMTIVGPLLMAALMIAPVYLTKIDQDEMKTIAVIDDAIIFDGLFQNTKNMNFTYLKGANKDSLIKVLSKTDYYALLYIPYNITYSKSVEMYSDKTISLGVQMHISNTLEKELEKSNLKKYDIKDIDNILQAVKCTVQVMPNKLTSDGKIEKASTGIRMAVGLVAGILIYFFIFMYGSQVMRGVIEEKTSRIVEVIISSVRPFQLMMGKIIGVALVGLTQFFLWVILTWGIMGVASTSLIKDSDIFKQNIQAKSLQNTSTFGKGQTVSSDSSLMIKDAFKSLRSINFGIMIGSFLFYFLFGYLLYAALFGAIGSAVDSEADTQQFMMPVTIPLILAIVMSQSVIQNPEGSLAFWFSMIPLTSPVIMMIRIPFGVPYWQIATSMILLIGTFVAATWLAGKIYRTGILMYGKKVNYKELWKWIRYKN